MYYKDLFEVFHHSKIRYVVVGGLAVVLKGIPRLTMDIDIIVDFEENNLRRALGALDSLGFKPKLPVNPDDFLSAETRKSWRKEKNMLVFNFYHPNKPAEQIDIFTELPFSFSELYDSRTVEKLGDIEIPVVSTQHLIEMKKTSGRKQDMADIEQLEKLNEKKGKR